MIDLIKRIIKGKGNDRGINFCVAILTIYGIIMIGSASVGQTAVKGANFATINMIKQTIFVCGGYFMMFMLTRLFKPSILDTKWFGVIFFVGVASLFACLPFEAKGSHAWIPIGPFTLQPSEFVKIIMILFCAYHFGEVEQLCIIPKNISAEKKELLQQKKFWYCFLQPVLVCFFVFIVIGFLQKDLGSALILIFVCMMMFYCSPRPYYKRLKIAALGLMGIGLVFVVLVGALVLKEYQLGRIITWLNPLKDPLNDGWQLTNALIAFAGGGLFGRGFGASRQKYGYIAESHNDFISAIIFEELGLVGFLLFLIPYVYIIYKMFDYGFKVENTSSKLILFGIGTYFFTHLLINVGGVSGLIPMTGVPLLLISSGGSSTMAAMCALGIGQSIIARYNRDQLKEQIS